MNALCTLIHSKYEVLGTEVCSSFKVSKAVAGNIRKHPVFHGYNNKHVFLMIMKLKTSSIFFEKRRGRGFMLRIENKWN